MGTKRMLSCSYLLHSTGGLTFVCTAKALLGFVRFTRHYYLTVATEVKAEGVIMGHMIYSISVERFFTHLYRVTTWFRSAQFRIRRGCFHPFYQACLVPMFPLPFGLIHRSWKRRISVCLTWWICQRGSSSVTTTLFRILPKLTFSKSHGTVLMQNNRCLSGMTTYSVNSARLSLQNGTFRWFKESSFKSTVSTTVTTSSCRSSHVAAGRIGWMSSF